LEWFLLELALKFIFSSCRNWRLSSGLRWVRDLIGVSKAISELLGSRYGSNHSAEPQSTEDESDNFLQPSFEYIIQSISATATFSEAGGSNMGEARP
jgi:hypothetical protein